MEQYILYIISSLLFFYISSFYFISRRLVYSLEHEADEKLDHASQNYREAVRKKDTAYLRRMTMEEEAFKVFTLFEITKDITKSLTEEEAFNVFKEKLAEHIDFSDCQLIESGSEKLADFKKGDDYFIFELKSKDHDIGHLAMKGVSPEKEETVRILGHQFALAMRRVILYQEIGKVAITDGLTGIYTRRYTLGRLQEEIERSKLRKIEMSYLMIDVDHFKSINDAHGHLAGDQVLREVGQILKDNIREIDIAGRYGGEEFCIVLPDTDREGAMFAAERIRKAAELALIHVYDIDIKITVSIGIALFPKDGKVYNEIIDKADWALYRSKKRGRNCVTTFGVFEE